VRKSTLSLENGIRWYSIGAGSVDV
jgi:hypothetical protein